MEQNIYIKVKDSKNNWNIWQLVNELDNTYEIHSRATSAFVEKEYCFCEAGSPLLYYNNGDMTIDINKSSIEVESELEYQKLTRHKNKCINPYARVEQRNLDFGYLEDLGEEEKWEHMKRG